jgi:hypothetical protein
VKKESLGKRKKPKKEKNKASAVFQAVASH